MSMLTGNTLFVPLIVPKADVFASASTSDVFKMTNHNHATMYVHCGASSADADVTITVQEQTSSTQAGAVDIGFNYRTRATGDTWGALTAATTAGVDPSTATLGGWTVAIELDADELSDGSNWVSLTVTESTDSVAIVGGAFAILSECRYAEDVIATAIA